MPNFRAALKNGQRLYFDGGMGTMLMARGMPAGMSPEEFAQKEPTVVSDIHRLYVQAGARVITTNSFGASRFKLRDPGAVRETNRYLAALARAAAPEQVFVAGDIGPTGVFMPPLGQHAFEDLCASFREQAAGLADGGADLILIETQFDLAEARAAVTACRQVCDLPVAVSMTFEDGVSLTGTPPAVFAQTMLNLDVDLVGINCSNGPYEMLPLIKELRRGHDVPVMVQPNAGLPELVNGQMVFPMNPEEFATAGQDIARLGVQVLGGCCGTTPEHIRALIKATLDIPVEGPAQSGPRLYLTSRSASVALGPDQPLVIIGERINPTGKKALTQEFQEGRLGLAASLATEQLDMGAGILDVNVGAPLVNEEEFLPALTAELSARFPAPLCLDSPNERAIAAALPVYPASCLINSISGEDGKMDRLGPLCARFGAPFILLPLKGGSLPATAKDRLDIIEALLARALALGIPKRLILVDALALTVSSRPDAARQCLEVIKYCTERLGLPTVFGLSNISFGLPARELINSTFLTMAATAGLSACIANPNSARLREALGASELLLGRDPQAENFITRFNAWKPGTGVMESVGDKKSAQAASLYEAVLIGDKDALPGLLQAELAKTVDPLDIVNQSLIPAITEVGEKYRRKEYFLPQLLRSAETMQSAFASLEPLLAKDNASADRRPRIVMATVEGDIHDIGKNIVTLMLKNHGFEVMDLGKDVRAEDIVQAAQDKGAFLIGLSALMTTTMTRMEETVRLIRERRLPIKVMVGGAVLSDDYARAIGADGYSGDAVGAVKLARELSGAVTDEG